MTEFDDGAANGLPGPLPAGERLLWQGKPDARVLARAAFHTPLVGAYFALLAGWALATPLARGGVALADLLGVASTVVVGAACLGVLNLLAWAAARATVYTLTDRRLVLRIGVAVPKCINLPLTQIGAVDLALRSDGSGDLALSLVGAPKLGWLALWPHARAWRIVRPEPMLRALPDAEKAAALIGRTCLAANPQGRMTPVVAPVSTPALGGAVAA